MAAVASVLVLQTRWDISTGIGPMLVAAGLAERGGHDVYKDIASWTMQPAGDNQCNQHGPLIQSCLG
jgi:hypothetical protein